VALTNGAEPISALIIFRSNGQGLLAMAASSDNDRRPSVAKIDQLLSNDRHDRAHLLHASA